MEYEKIKQLMEDMGNSKLTNIDIDFPDGTKISMKKESIHENVVIKTVQEPVMTTIENSTEKVFDAVSEKNSDTVNKPGEIVKSPMVGTFYSKPSPTSPSYVEVGKHVNKGETLCIIEAMKLMNEIESEFTGKIAEVLVNDGDVVEYGTPLFRIEV